MDRAAAKTRLSSMVAASSRPVLTDLQLEDLIDQGAVQDVTGNYPSAATWTPTWDLNVSAMEGWRWKAAQVAGDFTFSADGASFDKGAVLVQIERMVALYAAKCHGSTAVKARTDSRLYDYTALLP